MTETCSRSGCLRQLGLCTFSEGENNPLYFVENDLRVALE